MSDNYSITKVAGIYRAKAVITSALQREEWEELQSELVDLLKKNYLRWEINLEEVETFLSTDLGMLVSINMVIKNYSGKLELKVRRDSTLSQLLAQNQLEQVLAVTWT